MQTFEPLEPLIAKPAEQPRRQNKTLLYGVAIAGGVLLCVGWLLSTRPGPTVNRDELPLRDRPPSEQGLLDRPVVLPKDLTLNGSYVGKPLPKVAEAPPVKAESAPAPAPSSPPPASAPATTAKLPVRPQPPASLVPPTQAPPVASAAPAPKPATAPAPKTEPKKEEEKPWRWYGEEPKEQNNLMTSPFPEKEKDVAGKQSSLFPKPTFERPKDPYKVLYADQLVYAQMSQDVSSEHPGSVRFKVIRDVEDRWGHGHVLVPMDSVFLGKQQASSSGNPNQETIPVEITTGIFPDGSSMSFTGGQVGDAGGKTGLPGDVDRHIGRKIGLTAMAALAGIGLRIPAGTPGENQYFQSLPQEAAQNAGQRSAQMFQQMLQQQLNAPNTITQQHGFPVTLQFSQHVYFGKAVVVGE